MKTYKILIIDDSFINNLLFTDILKDAGFLVQSITSSKIAIDKIKSYKPEIILLDIMMPFINGLQLLKEIKTVDELKEIPVVIITADIKPASFETAKQLGAIDYITKPIGAFELVRTVRGILKIEDGQIG